MKTFLSLIFLLTINFSFSQDISGTWSWSSSNDENFVEISLSNNSNSQIVGSYCSIFQQGNKIDCAESEEPCIYLSVSGPDIFTGTFKSSFSNTTGQIKLTLVNPDKLHLEIISEPDGEFYLPHDIYLQR
tara:strand:- start:48605 stop:48994 length:390 start_codon:yes stop_codon:yes gene_type:complete